MPPVLKGKHRFINGIDVTVPIERYDLANLPKQQGGKYHKIDFNELKSIEFAVGVTYSDFGKQGWGVHTFILTKGQVYEVHWDKGPTSRNLFTAYPIEQFMKNWPMIVLAVSPQK